MEKLIAFLLWLDGKKTFIASFLGLTVAFLSLKHVLDQDTAAYFQGVLALVAGSAEVATVKLGARMGGQKQA